MKYCMLPVINRFELEKEIKLQYDVELNIDYLFYGYSDDEFNYLGIDEQWDGYEDEDEDSVKRKLVRQHLRDIMPEGTDAVIIEI